jgi:hypothetical protein
MLRLEFRWYVWLFALLVVFMIWKGPGTMEWFGGGLLRAFADIGDALVKGLRAVQTCAHNPCGS